MVMMMLMVIVITTMLTVMLFDDGQSNGDNIANGDDDVSGSGCERWRWK